MILRQNVFQNLPQGRIRYQLFVYFGLRSYLFFYFLMVSVLHIADGQGYSRTRDLDGEELLEQLPALQQLLYRLIGCRVLF